MPRLPAASRRIALFVEGSTECGEARRRTLPEFFHRWLDPLLPPDRRVGIVAVRFQGVSNYLDDVGQKVALYLDQGRADAVLGVIDLYGIPRSRIDLLSVADVPSKVRVARAAVRKLVRPEHQGRFRQHFAVHETEAWLLADASLWPAEVRGLVGKRPPEQVNMNEPPAQFLKRILGTYKKTTMAMNLFPKLDPNAAAQACPHLRILLEDLKRVADLLVAAGREQ